MHSQGRSAVELGVGHMQYGKKAYGVARGLNFRVFCASCLWLSIYFYSTEAPGGAASAGSGMTVLPLAFWVPCRIPAAELFPVRHTALPGGSDSSEGALLPRPPATGSATAMARLASSEDPLAEVVRQRADFMDVSSRRRSVLHGTCRESLQRALQRSGAGGGPAGPTANLPPVLPELLPMHDMSSLLSFSSNLELLMGVRQRHQGPGLEQYQDKIMLTQEFRSKGFPVPTMYYASYAADFDVRPVLRQLEAEGTAYVAKASHMCCSRGVFVMDGGVDRLTNRPASMEEIQVALQDAFLKPFSAEEVDARCGDWGTVQAGRNPGVLVEELLQPSIPLQSILAPLGGGEWVTPDSLACHIVWSAVLQCIWEIKIRRPDGKLHTEALGVFFRDGSCFSCRFPNPFGDGWSATVDMLENMVPHSDYVRISLFIRDGRPIINEIEYTTGGLEVVPVRIAREWTLQWLEGYYRYLS
ncbi:unnamed protein product [Polarella glacialis]|uniref:Uncharacterized protein n=1 Tax=Polarella glacialis TaxID=89957 RepID=A0A813DQQ1_POLGL|nr:unnamed protein product [Polarella glacialis]